MNISIQQFKKFELVKKTLCGCTPMMIALFFVSTVLISFPTKASEAYVISNQRGVSVGGWEYAIPKISYDENTGVTTFEYGLPDGRVLTKRYKPEQLPADPGAWVKNGINELKDSPPGYTKKGAKKLLDWWANGGRGAYKIENGKLVKANYGDAYLNATDDSLSVERWDCIKPEVYQDTKTNKWMVAYHHPDGQMHSWSIEPNEKVGYLWAKKGVGGFEKYPAGYSVEDTSPDYS